MPGSSRRTIRSIRSSSVCLPRCKSPPSCSSRTGFTMPNERHAPERGVTPPPGSAAAWRMVYRLALYLLLPLALTRLWWRGRRNPAEALRPAAAPLIKWLLARGETVLVTTTTPSGSDRVRALFGQDVHHSYCHYDLPGAVKRFLRRARPRLALVMETELWLNLFHACAAAGVPVIVANARLSARSARAYQRFATLTHMTLAEVTLTVAQAEADAARLHALGAADVRVSGNIKFDLHLPASLHEQAAVLRRGWGESRQVWLAASTHAGEEEQVLDAHATVRATLPGSLLVLAPRHPERGDAVAALCRQRGFAVLRRSARRPADATVDIFLVDTLGELPLFCAAADTVFVGGSLVPTGGHNVLEPAARGKAVIVGPHTFNFLEITEQLGEQGAATRVGHSLGLTEAVIIYLSDANRRDCAGRQGLALVEQSRGALARLQELLERYLCEPLLLQER